ncbi:hypothetical protein RvY_04669 [Ramazzottius varieornatus]|uniref:Uncharacterized protein n=1 Tax=Ramazzottius varieornatus TaxID=947166 RepID=A0A1D1V1L4_RAMVA|nr:hypothetical protein RvY_04669 [Ramazzottius varieornatus]
MLTVRSLRELNWNERGRSGACCVMTKRPPPILRRLITDVSTCLPRFALVMIFWTSLFSLVRQTDKRLALVSGMSEEPKRFLQEQPPSSHEPLPRAENTSSKVCTDL